MKSQLQKRIGRESDSRESDSREEGGVRVMYIYICAMYCVCTIHHFYSALV